MAQYQLNYSGSEINQLLAKISVLESKLNTLQTTVNNIDTSSIQSELNTVKQQVQSINDELDTKDTTISNIQTKLTELENTINSLNSSIDTKDAQVLADSKAYTDEQILKVSAGGSVDLSGYAKKTDIPTKTSQLTNDSGFLTEHQNISGKADKSYVDTELAKKSDKTHTHSYNDLSDKPVIPSIDGLATKKELTDGLATKSNTNHTHDQYLTEHQDLSNYALKTEIPSVPTKTSQLTNDSNFISSIPEEYVTEQELNSKGFATETFVTNKIAEASLSGGEVDLSGYATKDELNSKANIEHTHTMSNITDLVIPDVDKAYVDTQLNTKANKSDIPNLDGYALKTDIPTVPTKVSDLTNDSNFISSIPEEYVTETELNAKGLATETFVRNKISEASLGGDSGSGSSNTGVNVDTIISSAPNRGSSIYNAKPIRPLISFTDDDGKAGVYTKWLPIIQEKNIPVSFCIITNFVGNDEYLTWEQIKELQDNYGCEILSHTQTHTNIGSHNTNKTWIEELKQSKETLMAHGLNVRGLAYPNGGFWGTKEGLVHGTDNGHWMTALFYDYGITTQSSINIAGKVNNMGIDRAGIGCYAAQGRFDTLDNIKARVDECYDQNGWLIFMTHVDDAGHTDEDNQMLRDLIDYIQAKGIDIVTMSEGFEIFGNVIETPGCKITKQGKATLDVSATVPKATTSSTGVVQIGNGLAITDGVISVDKSLYYDKTYIDNILDVIQNDIENLKASGGGGGGSADSVPIIGNIASIKATPNTNFDITYTVIDSDGIAAHQISFDGGVEYSVIEPVAGDNNTYTYTAQLSEEKDYNCKLKVTDTLGNSAIKSFSVKIQYSRYYFDKVTRQGSAEINKEEGIYKITDSTAYDNVVLYDTTGAFTDTNKTYTLCIKTLTKDIVGEPNFEFTKLWSIQNLKMPKVNDLVVGETIKKTFNISQPLTASDRFLYLQFDESNTGSVIELQIWVEL